MRWLCRNWRPTRLARVVNRIDGWLAATGLPPRSMVALEVTGRSTGRIRTTVLAMPQYGGNRYLVSMLGNNSSWVRNARANPDAVIRHGRRRSVRLVEIPASQRAPVLKKYVRIARSGRRHFPVAPRCPSSTRSPIGTACSVSIPADRRCAGGALARPARYRQRPNGEATSARCICRPGGQPRPGPRRRFRPHR